MYIHIVVPYYRKNPPIRPGFIHVGMCGRGWSTRVLKTRVYTYSLIGELWSYSRDVVLFMSIYRSQLCLIATIC